MKKLTSEKIAEVFKIQSPLDSLTVTQIFGVNGTDWYKQLGLNGHSGVDFRARTPLPCYAVCDGFVTGAGFDSGGGGYVDIETHPFKVGDQVIKLEFRYYHLSKILVKAGTWVNSGDKVALTGNTGRYTTAPHLHFAMTVYYKNGDNWAYDGLNGFGGKVDPMPLIQYDWRLPVDKFYNKKRSLVLEYTFRFANTPTGEKITPFLSERIKAAQYVHRRLMQEGRTPPHLTNRESNAIIYGSWDLDFVLEPANFQTWSQMTKAEYLKKLGK